MTAALTPAPPASLASDLVALRRELHQDPEVGLNLPRTQARVLDALRGLDLEITLGKDCTSVVAVLRGNGNAADAAQRPVVLLRGDMDALPITERTGLPYASRNGAMHACGHDLHTAGLVGAATILSSMRNELPGDVILMFQPGEEGYNGAQAMIDEGVLDAAGNRPIGAYGVHVASDAPAGVFMTRPGPYMAAFDLLEVTVEGRSGHASRPYQALDPIQVAAEMIGSLQTFITRRFNVFDPVVLTVGEFHAGSAPNVIPDAAVFSAGIRCFSTEVEAQLQSELPDLVRGIAAAHRLTARVALERKLPPTINNPQHATFWASTARRLYGDDRFESLPYPKAGSEDFSRILMAVPGSFGHYGAGSPDIDPADWSPIHSSTALFDDAVLVDQANFMAHLAQRRLQLVSHSLESLNASGTIATI